MVFLTDITWAVVVHHLEDQGSVGQVATAVFSASRKASYSWGFRMSPHWEHREVLSLMESFFDIWVLV